MAIHIKSRGRFGAAMQDAMTEQGVSVDALSAYCDMHFEHIRKMIRGSTYPSPMALAKVCEKLRLDPKKMDQLIVADKIEKKFGGIPHVLIGQHEELGQMAPYWDRLRPEQKATLKTMLMTLADQNVATPAPVTRRRRRA